MVLPPGHPFTCRELFCLRIPARIFKLSVSNFLNISKKKFILKAYTLSKTSLCQFILWQAPCQNEISVNLFFRYAPCQIEISIHLFFRYVPCQNEISFHLFFRYVPCQNEISFGIQPVKMKSLIIYSIGMYPVNMKSLFIYSFFLSLQGMQFSTGINGLRSHDIIIVMNCLHIGLMTF